MLIEDFKKRYTSIPFAVYEQNYKEREGNGIFHLHREIEILLVREGYALLFLENREIKIKKGDIVFIPPFTPHRYKIPKDSYFSHRCICFDSSLLYNIDPKVSTSIINDSDAFKLINRAFDSYLEKKKGFELFIVGNLSLFFARLYEHNLIDSAKSAPSSFHKSVIDYIDKNYHENITSTDIANTLHINHSYFCRLFKKNFGSPFQKYLSSYRIEKSKSLLKNSDLPISEIALKVGFNSISYFTKLFKEEFSITPTEYRNKK